MRSKSCRQPGCRPSKNSRNSVRTARPPGATRRKGDAPRACVGAGYRWTPKTASELVWAVLALVLIDQPCADRTIQTTNLVQQFTAIVIDQIHIQHDVTDLAVGLEILGHDIDVAQ